MEVVIQEFAPFLFLYTFVARFKGGLYSGDVAQLVEQRTENPCVGGSIPSVTTLEPLVWFTSLVSKTNPRQPSGVSY